MTIRITWRRTLLAIVAAALLGLGIGWSGAINVGASTGHWAVTDWFLHWVMRKSVRTHAALTVDAPATDTTGLASAAGHFAGQCSVCHGAPGERPSPVMQAATPPAPDLAVNARDWTDEQLFWILKHGVKFSGMPAWPVQDRDDEVRRMAAFVRRLPAMTPETYRALAYGPGGRINTGTVRQVADAVPDCARCHGADGQGRGPDVPVLAGQKAAYLEAALRDYATGRRHSGVMQSAAARIDAPTMRGLATLYAAMPRPVVPAAATARDATGDLADAARIVGRGISSLNVPACASCHGMRGRADYPRLDGQKAAYLAARLHAFRGEKGVVDARKSPDIMPTIARRLPEASIDDLARYYATR
ncbi:c-type cytochrome [Sphingomonas prati]|uniref:Cytochrome c553 n=1 Tax=Sphingomonas prati TaxID=1843237 RepID=A0A7W9BRK3_9SPHN|nr:c-type cytochrome [Sphingomonas prati]MBB5728725.1 cytochrome c553 [Sphingomonas prati]GGE71607.1 cytochrome c [Sphingomonas prati]